MSGRGRGRSERTPGRGGRWSKKKTTNKPKDGSTTQAVKTRTKIEDYVYSIGSSKAASDFAIITDYLINYIRTTFTNGEDIAVALEARKVFDFTTKMPQMLLSVSTDVPTKELEDKQYGILYQAEINNFVKRKATYEANRSNAYGTFVGQCSKALLQKLETRTDWMTTIKGDPILLLQAIEEHSLTYKENKYEAAIVVESMESFFKTKQRDDEDLVDFTRRFKSAKDVLESHMGSPIWCTKMLEADPDWKSADITTHRTCRNTAAAKIYALLYLRNVDQTKYGSVLKGLEAQFSLGMDQYPKQLTAAIGVLSDHPYDAGYAEARRRKKEKERSEKDRLNSKNKDKDEVSLPLDMTFAQIEDKCFCCGKKGHKSPQCPQKDKIARPEWAINKTTGKALNQVTQSAEAPTSVVPPPVQQAMTTTTTATDANTVKFDWMGVQAVSLNQATVDMTTWVLLDTGSSVNVFCNHNLVKNIRATTETLHVYTNAGTFSSRQKADLPWCDMETWYDPNSITNVLSFAIVAKQFKITYDNSVDDVFKVHTKSGLLEFKQLSENLYLFIPGGAVSMLNTVKENKTFYTNRQLERAKAARALSRAIGCPSDNDLRAILKMNSIKDCPVVEADITLAQKIFGKDVAILKGKLTRRKPSQVVADTVAIPNELKLAQYEVTLCIDTFYVNGMTFFHTISERIAYRTTQWVPNKDTETYSQYFDVVMKIYRAGGFKVTMVCADNEFGPLLQNTYETYGFLPNLANPLEHVPIVERSIRTVKERCRATVHGLPFKAIPRVLIKALVQECTRKLNYFPAKGGCSDYYSPREILHETKLDFKLHCSIQMLSYVLAHDEPDPSNTNAPRALDCIYMRPKTTIQGGHEVLHLATNCVISRRTVTEVPMTDAIINAVEALAQRDNIDPFKMETKHGIVLYDASTEEGDGGDNTQSESESEMESESEDNDSNDDQDDQDRDAVDPNEIYDTPVVDREDKTNDVNQDESTVDDNEDGDDGEDNDVQEDDLAGEVQPTVRRSTRVPVQRQVPNVANTAGKSYGATMNQMEKKEPLMYSMRDGQVLAMIMCRFNETMETTVKLVHGVQHVVTYSLKKALNKFGKPAKVSADKEMQQMLDRKCFEPIHKADLSAVERQRAMESLLFLNEKRDGTIKSRFCANGSTQRTYMEREEVASPTVSTESTMLTGVIEAEEDREVATCDIPNAFVQTEVSKLDKDGHRTIMKIRGPLVNLLCGLDSCYADYVVYEGKSKDVPVLYVHVLKAIYGMLVSAILFYKKLIADLEAYGFEVNPYDPCVANKMVDGKQLTVSWHVDDLKISHVKKIMVDQFLEWIKTTYGSIGEVKVSRGKIHEYLGMKLDYSVKGQLSVNMIAYVETMLKSFPQDDLKGTAPKAPWTEHLFKVNDGCDKLEPEKAELFHTVVAQGLFLCKRGRPDIAPAIAFLTTRVKGPDTDDWSKLAKMMLFLKHTVKDVLTLRADGTRVARFHVDAAFAVHPDFRSQTGSVFTLGDGAIASISKKQGLNTRSSTEAELVAADEVVGSMIWTKNFLESQGYPLKENILFQDNQSAILLETNGRASVGKRSRHLNIRMFFVADQKAKGHIDIQYCPTDLMTGDYMTKPLHGKKFVGFRQQIMNLPMTVQLFMTAVVMISQ